MSFESLCVLIFGSTLPILVIAWLAYLDIRSRRTVSGRPQPVHDPACINAMRDELIALRKEVRLLRLEQAAVCDAVCGSSKRVRTDAPKAAQEAA